MQGIYSPEEGGSSLACDSLIGLDRHFEKVLQVGLARAQSPY